MDSQDSPLSPGIDDDAATHASLQLELRVPERQMVAAFRDAFLRWLNDRAGPFAHQGGHPEGLSLDEVPDTDGPGVRSLLRLSVRWSFAPQPATRFPVALPPPSVVPAAASQNLRALDRFVFFPDPPQTGAPIFQEVSMPLHRDQLPPRPVRVAPPVSTTVLRRAGRGAGAAIGLAQAAQRRLGLSALTIRTPLAARGSRLWGAALFGAAAVAVGFTAGSIYLARPTRGTASPERPTVALTATAEPIAAAPATAPAAAMPLGDSLPGAEQPGHPVDVLTGRASGQALPPTSSALGIADAEVTTRRGPSVAAVPAGPASPARPVADHGAAPVVVRAADVTGTSGPDRMKARGALLVKSEPQGAEVSINGVVHGRTPLVIRDLGAGSRVVRLDLAGYERWSWAVAVVANRRTPVSVKLQPEVRGARQE